jgi:branched-subunit amino acid transport protein
MVIFMSLVTYIPRMLPIIYLNNKKLPDRLKRFLYFIPFAALGALIFPGVLTSTKTPQSALVGSIVSVILAYLRLNLVLVVIGGIGSVLFFELIF